MSASNWAVCPRCLERRHAERDAFAQQAEDGYGVLSAEEYEVLRAKGLSTVDEDEYRTLREDYEIYGARSGVVTVTYSGHCQTCKLGLDFKHERALYAREEEAS